MKISCTHCGNQYEVEDRYMGQTLKCPDCGNEITINNPKLAPCPDCLTLISKRARTCPHCGAPLCGNTIDADSYIEEGYLPQWMAYTRWLTGTVNRPLLVLELGEGFKTPTVIRWPFEKTVRFNKKSCFYRVNAKFAQLAEETDERSVSVAENSVDWVSAMLKTL